MKNSLTRTTLIVNIPWCWTLHIKSKTRYNSMQNILCNLLTLWKKLCVYAVLIFFCNNSFVSSAQIFIIIIIIIIIIMYTLWILLVLYVLAPKSSKPSLSLWSVLPNLITYLIVFHSLWRFSQFLCSIILFLHLYEKPITYPWSLYCFGDLYAYIRPTPGNKFQFCCL